ncbi:hypothetical protein EBN03_32015 [Nocardia stercoris]|uniref:Uncharacterized protein n=1 Tax=Nocardia stercoris TaxID=2483361 RepID=A0A3M2KSF8_9NOCA|nr:hypothetical protein EBN03_32015 [Nocardia stercoris]
MTTPGEQVLLRVRCGRGHHVATVFETLVGPVFRSTVGPRAHGDRDFADAAHGAHGHGTRFADLLSADEFTDDGLPATCECGPHILSCTLLRQALERGERTVHLG